MIQVLKYNEAYYISSADSNILINGVKPTPTNWNGWFVSETKVKSISKLEKEWGKLSHYELVEEWTHLSDKFPMRIELGEFDDEDPKSAFYKSVYSPTTDKEVPIEFNIREVSVQPEHVPWWVNVRWPESMTEIREIAHIYPCSVYGSSLYYLIWDAVVEKMKGNPNFRYSNYTTSTFEYQSPKKETGRLVVSRRIFIPDTLQKTEIEYFYKNTRSNKQSERKFVRKERWNIIFQISNGKDKDNFLLPEIKADNYAELKKLVDEKVKYYVDQIDDYVWSECECCKGIGLTRKESK